MRFHSSYCAPSRLLQRMSMYESATHTSRKTITSVKIMLKICFIVLTSLCIFIISDEEGVCQAFSDVFSMFFSRPGDQLSSAPKYGSEEDRELKLKRGCLSTPYILLSSQSSIFLLSFFPLITLRLFSHVPNSSRYSLNSPMLIQ